MTEEVRKQLDLGVTFGRHSDGDALQVALSEKDACPSEMQPGSSFRVTQGNHFIESGEQRQTGAGEQPGADAQALGPFIGSGHPGYPGHAVHAVASPLQPPIIGANLRDAVSRLAREAASTPTPQQFAHITHGSIADTYVTQIINWSQRLTPVQLGRKYSIEEVIALAGLKGRYREHASVRYTGEALRRCGFVTKRDWTTAGRNKRFWVKGV